MERIFSQSECIGLLKKISSALNRASVRGVGGVFRMIFDIFPSSLFISQVHLNELSRE